MSSRQRPVDSETFSPRMSNFLMLVLHEGSRDCIELRAGSVVPPFNPPSEHLDAASPVCVFLKCYLLWDHVVIVSIWKNRLIVTVCMIRWRTELQQYVSATKLIMAV